MADQTMSVECCIVGGGPAGMMLGFLLARSGVEVVVLEKHKDFLRDFRGDTIHPSTLELMHELGLLEAFLRLPHQEVRQLDVQFGEQRLPFADFTHLPTRCKFLAFMPQWDFLDFLAAEGRRYPGFHLAMEAEVEEVVTLEGRVRGVRAATPGGPLEVIADLVVGADGRHSLLRERAGLAVRALGAPMDVLWFRLTRTPDDPADLVGRFDQGRIFIMINRGEHWQCAFVIPKGGFDGVKTAGLEAFRRDVAALAPFLAQRLAEIASWDDVKLLTVAVDRLTEWHRPGLLFIGDAAHAMSPVGGVGINLAVQDAVAAANILARPLATRSVEPGHLAAVQRRREWPTRITQRFQVLVQNHVIGRVLSARHPLSPPLVLALFGWFPVLRRLPARVVGLGFRPEHVRTEPAAPRR